MVIIEVLTKPDRLIKFLFYINILSKNLKTKIYKTIILPVVLYDCETLSLTLREERRLRVLYLKTRS